MSLKTCRECGNSVSSSAKICLHCGIESPGQKKSMGCLGVIATSLLILYMIGYFGSDERNTIDTAPLTGKGKETQVITRPSHSLAYSRIRVNVRSAPGTTHEIVSSLDPGQEVYLGSSEQSGWASLFDSRRSLDTLGYVSRDLMISGSAPRLLLMSREWQSPRDAYGSPHIVGEIKNTSSKTLSYVQITCQLFDEQGRQIGNAMDNVNNLAPGGIWKYSALVFEDGARTYRCTEVTGF